MIKKHGLYRWGKMSNLGPIEKFELNIPFERAHSKLSEYHKIIEIGSTEVELWPLKVIVFSQMTVV